jgi:NAD(P)-dependent dehydrogenase (short-subunit alcohol dehydrogenase family)
MHIDLTGKTAVVTGSTAGIGFAIAKGLAGTGASVVVNGRTQQAVDRAVSELTAFGRVRGVAADLATAQGCAQLVEAVPACDILINNMGIFEMKDFFDTPDDDWERFFATNVLSGVRLSRAYLPGMAERHWGRVVFISSESALNIPAAMIHYGFTKTAQLSVSRGLAKTIDECGTAFVKAHRPSSIIQRMATVDEVANMVVYVASEQASATTGAALRVDGGVVDTIA